MVLFAYMCVCAFSLHRESPNIILGDKPLISKVLKNERMKLQRFHDSVRKKLAELQRDTEAVVATLDGRSAEFCTDVSLSDFFEWFQMEVTMMPTTLVECNENITCYALFGIF
jgi:hypothetical protein